MTSPDAIAHNPALEVIRPKQPSHAAGNDAALRTLQSSDNEVESDFLSFDSTDLPRFAAHLVTVGCEPAKLRQIALERLAPLATRIRATEAYFASAAPLKQVYLGRRLVSDDANPKQLTHRAGRLSHAVLATEALTPQRTASFANLLYWNRQVDMKTRYAFLRLLRQLASNDLQLVASIVSDSLEDPTITARQFEPYEADYLKAAQRFAGSLERRALHNAHARISRPTARQLAGPNR